MPRLRLAAFLGQYGLTRGSNGPGTNLHTVVQAVKAGMGVSVLSPVLMREELAAGTLREIPVEGFAETRRSRWQCAGVGAIMLPWSVFWTSVRNSPPSSEPGFYQDKDKQRKETPGRSGFFCMLSRN